MGAARLTGCAKEWIMINSLSLKLEGWQRKERKRSKTETHLLLGLEIHHNRLILRPEPLPFLSLFSLPHTSAALSEPLQIYFPSLPCRLRLKPLP